MWGINVMGILEEKKNKWIEELFEIIIIENFPKLVLNYRTRKFREYQAG